MQVLTAYDNLSSSDGKINIYDVITTYAADAKQGDNKIKDSEKEVMNIMDVLMFCLLPILF